MQATVTSLYPLLKLLTSQTECLTCRLCEENVGLVYLLGDESKILQNDNIKCSITSEGVAYLQRNENGFCSCFDIENGRCKIYQKRPLCCRIYPLDLIQIDGKLWWVVHAECPISQRFKSEHRLDVLIAITKRIELDSPQELFKEWLDQENTSHVIEAFLFEKLKVIKLRQFRQECSFI